MKLGKGNVRIAFLLGVLLFSPAVGAANLQREPREPLLVAAASTSANSTFQAGMELYRGGTIAAWQGAIARWTEALEQAKKDGDRETEALTLTWLGNANSNLKDLPTAAEVYSQALKIYRETSDRHSQASTLMSLGSIHATRGEYQKAFETNEEALKLWQAVQYKTGEAATLNNIALIYGDLGDFNTALDYHQRALKLIENAGNSLNVAATLNNIGRSYSDSGKTTEALATYNRALSLWQEGKNVKGQASTLNNIGYLYASAKNWAKAREYYQQAFPLWQQLQDKGGEASTLTNIGYVEANAGNRDRALEAYNRAIPLRQASGDRAKEALTRYRLAALRRDLGNFTEAKGEIEAAIAIIEDLRTNISRSDLRASFFASKQDYYELYIDLLMQQHKRDKSAGYDKLALQTSERARARTLLDVLQEARADIRQGVDPKLRDRERQLQQQLSAAEEQRFKLANAGAPQEQIDTLSRELETLIERYRNLQAEIRTRSPRYAALTQPEPLGLEPIQQQVLDDRTVLLEYYLGAERSYLWMVTRDGLASYELPGRAEIEKAAKTYLSLLKNPAQRRRTEQVEEARSALSQVLLSPVREQLKGERLLIVGDGILQYLPFASLSVNGNTPLIADFEVITLPSASTLAILRGEQAGRKSGTRALAIFADPVFAPEDERMPKSAAFSQVLPMELQESVRASGILLSRLPFTKQEADNILAFVPSDLATEAIGFSANRNLAISDNLSQYRIIHFATHGLANSKNPELSGLVLSLFNNKGAPQNGFLRMHELFNLNLPADLVVLSACQTGLGEQIRGEGIIGLTRGFMYAGAARVVASLWNVDDRGTSELMTRFYRHMLQEDQTPAAALRAAQLEMSKTEEWRSPFYWAGFTLQGEWD
ncbi:CHAT domain-containing protein [Oscillatoria sp. FACHB-1406]|uniref:CHAT domain-containing protein n=1 Tax=Oscillatoria sp. FACHB-1406 TaxID=2692846 RepID=UPI00168515B6|nr:CHAT domain-containing protein [Oscillatoria sp. FACHB-1406]MBD2580234.1 CHAT domain-containing protein [Oscillatoria sp. FACHB-1406]